jgi:hypothetical protein
METGFIDVVAGLFGFASDLAQGKSAKAARNQALLQQAEAIRAEAEELHELGQSARLDLHDYQIAALSAQFGALGAKMTAQESAQRWRDVTGTGISREDMVKGAVALGAAAVIFFTRRG